MTDTEKTPQETTQGTRTDKPDTQTRPERGFNINRHRLAYYETIIQGMD